MVNGIVGSDIVLTTSTNGTSAIAALNNPGNILIQAPINNPPADLPQTAN